MTAQPADQLSAPSTPAVLAQPADAAALVPTQPAPAVAQSPAAPGVPQQLQPTQINVQVSAPVAPSIVIQVKQRGLFVRALYFLVVGSWLSGIAMFTAGLCIASVVLMPAGLAIVNRIPQIMTLRPRSVAVHTAMLADGSTQYTVGTAQQRSMLVRIVYFCFIGCWAGMLVMTAAWLLSVLIVTMPLGLMLINRVPAVFTLRRN